MAQSGSDHGSGQSGRKKLTGWIVGGLIGVVAALTALGLVLFGVIPGFGGNSNDALRLEGAEEPGAAAFMVADLVEPSSLITPIKKGATVPALPATVAAVNGTTPGLYGGSGSETCNPAQLKAFLGSNPDKAAAWVGALNADSNLRWGNGQKLTVAEIPVYIDNLVPTVLQQDTWVTNHGFAGGVATPFQSVLQRGTSVYVDRYGVPRARCLCGNPLLPPQLSNVPPGSQTTPPPAESTPPPSNEKPCIPVAGEGIDCPGDSREVPQLPIEGDPWEGFGEQPPSLIAQNPDPVDEFQVMTDDGTLQTRAVPFCEAYAALNPGAACPMPSPENATQVTGTSQAANPTDPATPTDPAQPSGWYTNPSPPAPSFDVCSDTSGIVTTGEQLTTSVTNNSGGSIDFWGPTVQWDENGVITSCVASYTGSLTAGEVAEIYTMPGAIWAAVDSSSGALIEQRPNSGGSWSIP